MKIDYIRKITGNNGNVKYNVYYKSGRKFSYTHNDNLPDSVLDMLLNGNCNTVYTSTGKIETFC